MNKEKGFTLIELVMVIVILGILAAVALPKFVDLSGNADQAAVDGTAGALSSAAAINYAACSAQGSAYTYGNNCVQIQNCTAAAGLLQGGALPSDKYSIASLAVAKGATATCTLTKSGNSAKKTAKFTTIGT